jgi:hypothetical protein
MRVPHVDFGSVTKVSGVGSPYQTAKGATPEAFGASIGAAMQGVGQQISKAGDVANKIALDIQQEDNEAEARERDAEFMRAINVEAYGGQLNPDDPLTKRSGFYNTKNKDTAAAHSTFNQAIQEHRNRIYGDGSNPAVKRLLEKQFNDRVFSQFQQSSRYAAQQKESYRKIQAESRQAASINLGVNGTQNDFVKAFLQIETDTRATLKNEGLAPEIVNERIAQKRSELIVSRIARLNSSNEPGDSKKAKALFEAQAALGNIDGKKHGALKAAIDKASIDAETNERYDKWIAVHPLETSIGDLDPEGVRKARAEAKTIKDSDIRKAFEAKIDKAVTRIGAVAKAEKNAIAGEIRQWLHDNPTQDIFDWKKISTKNGASFNRIAGDGYLFNSIVGTQTAIQKGQQFAKVTDGKTYQQTVSIPKTQLAQITDPKSQIPNWQKMTEGEQIKIARKIQNDKKEIAKLKQNPTYLSRTWPKLANNMPNKMAKAMKNASLPSTDPNFEIVMSAREEMRTWMLDDKQINNPPTDEQIARKAAEIMMDIESDPVGFGAAERSFTGYALQRAKMSPQQRAVATVPVGEIPEHIKKAIDADLQARRGVTDPDGRKQAQWVETNNRINEGDRQAVVEELAGAIAMGDTVRINTILGR